MVLLRYRNSFDSKLIAMPTDPFHTEVAGLRKSEGQQRSSHETPTKIGRFQIQHMLGSGGFGEVYLAIDEQLQRKVAIKLPHPRWLEEPTTSFTLLKEARTVAGLEHAHIVPVLEVGADSKYPIYIVSRYVEGKILFALCQSESFFS